MKTIKKIVLKNTLGITETTLEPSQINIIVGKKGTGKTSVLDAINLALSNKNIRREFIRKGETEASMYVELSDGTIIDRSKSIDKSDKIMVKKDGVIGSPESYLREMFSEKQFRPISFVESTTKEQNKVLLGLVDIKWSLEDLKKWFGEIPEGINFEQHILNILDDIQSKRGEYYLSREEINRDIKNKKAIAADILKSVPEGYKADAWRGASLAQYYGEVSKAQEHNQEIERQKNIVDGFEDKKKAIEGKYAKKTAQLQIDSQAFVDSERTKYSAMLDRIRMLQDELKTMQSGVDENKSQLLVDVETNEKDMQRDIISLEEKADLAKNIKTEPIDIEPLKTAAEHAENMKAFLNEYDNAMRIHSEIEGMHEESNEYTRKIDIARELPSELLKTVKSPVEGLSVEDGTPLIKGLPIQNMSTGEQLELAVEIAKQLSGELGVILVDKLECLDKTSQAEFIETCKKSGLQYFLTKVDDCEFDIIKV